jgi:hypothetical protein
MLKKTITFILLSLYLSTCSAVCVNKLVTEGEIKYADINDPDVIGAARYANNFAWINYPDQMNTSYIITFAMSQVVNGIKYYISIDYPEVWTFCHFEVIYQSWINKYSLVGNSCGVIDWQFPPPTKTIPTTTMNPESYETNSVISDADINDPWVVGAANYLIQSEISPQIQDSTYVIRSALSQIVNGIKYYYY